MVCRCLGDPPSCLLGSDLQSSHCTLDEACEDLDWDTEKGLEAMACNTEGFLPPKVMVSEPCPWVRRRGIWVEYSLVLRFSPPCPHSILGLGRALQAPP